VQLDSVRFRGGAGDRIWALFSTGYFELHVLAGVERQRGIQIDDQAAYLRGDVGEAAHHTGMIAHRMDVDTLLGINLALHDQIAARLGHAQQRAPLRALAFQQRILRRIAEIDFSIHYFGFACTAGAMRARVRQPNTFPQASIQHGLVGPAANFRAERLDSDFVRGHGGLA